MGITAFDLQGGIAGRSGHSGVVQSTQMQELVQ